MFTDENSKIAHHLLFDKREYFTDFGKQNKESKLFK